MIVADLIKNKDYDYISWRTFLPDYLDNEDCFIGACKSVKGELIPLDGDSYSDQEELLDYEEWSKEGIKNGLSVWIETEWIRG